MLSLVVDTSIGFIMQDSEEAEGVKKLLYIEALNTIREVLDHILARAGSLTILARLVISRGTVGDCREEIVKMYDELQKLVERVEREGSQKRPLSTYRSS